MTHLIKVVQILLHATAHPQACIDLIGNGSPDNIILHFHKNYYNIGQIIALYVAI